MRATVNLARLIRFAVVGVINTGVYYGLYLLLHTQVPYLVAHVCAFVIAMIGSYFLNCYVTFKTPPRWKTFLLFPLSNLANFVITTVGLKVAVTWLGVDQRIAPLPVALIAIPITYLVAHNIMLGKLRHHRGSGPASEGDGGPPVGMRYPGGTIRRTP